MTTPAASASATGSSVIAVLQRALAAEQAASYGYGVVGAHLTGTRQGAATTDWVAHMRARDALSAMISDRGGQPAPAAVAYQLPAPVTSAATAAILAVTLEEGVAAAYLAVVALPEQRLRAFGAGQVRAAAVRAEAWRGSPVAFPGLSASSLHS